MRARIWSRVFPESVQGRRSLFPLSGRIAIALIWTLLPALATAQTATGLGDTPQAGKTDPVAGDTTVTLESRKAPQPANKGDSRPVDIRVNKTLVLINVTVTDPLNRFVTGLEKEHFRLFEDKVEQEITEFSSEDAPHFDWAGLRYQRQHGAQAPEIKASGRGSSSRLPTQPMSFSWCNSTIAPS